MIPQGVEALVFQSLLQVGGVAVFCRITDSLEFEVADIPAIATTARPHALLTQIANSAKTYLHA